ncbi:MAG TPA: 3'-5' exonuclease [Usitatibacteraceae bacterium]|nr:3'-5' exonuclease [Usitatibacteraceae bacterium]
MIGRAARQVQGWLRRWRNSPRGAMQTQRWVVVDVETTGLNIRRDRLLAIGAVAMRGATLDVADSFEVILRQAKVSDPDNILVHRITGTAQREGVEPVEALQRFATFTASDPCVGFHAAFDQAMLDGEMQRRRQSLTAVPFLDLALLAPALLPQEAGLKSLDEWLERFDIRIRHRHHAVADALGTAMLFQCLLREASRQGITAAAALFSLASGQHWLQSGQPRSRG